VFKEALTQIVWKLEDAKKGGLLRGYGLIGGLALAAGGVTRATDLVDAQDLWAVRQPDANAVREIQSLADTLGLSGEFKAFLQRVAS
jgi:hypothetical protein